ncbi:ABC transporter permease, partial [bacterium]|nr:ABC transporter permease [bacterium]
MIEYILRRSLAAIPVLLGILVISFLVLYVIPGNPAEALAGPRASPDTLARISKEMGLDKPLYSQLFGYLFRVVQGDLGNSALTEKPVLASILEKFPCTLKLSLLSMLISIGIGLGMGIFGAIYQGTKRDRLCTALSVIGISSPVFLSGLILNYLFLVKIKVPFLIAGRGRHESFFLFVLPAITLGIRSGAFLARIVRSSVIEVLNQDYIRTARAKGLSPMRILFHHALRNALVPIITVVGLDFSSYLSGSVIVETIFGLPGIGRLTMDAISKRDYPVIQGIILFTSFVFVGMNLLVDIIYGLINPK